MTYERFVISTRLAIITIILVGFPICPLVPVPALPAISVMAEERTKYTAPIKELLPAGTSAQLEFLNESLTVGLTQAIERMKKMGITYKG